MSGGLRTLWGEFFGARCLQGAWLEMPLAREFGEGGVECLEGEMDSCGWRLVSAGEGGVFESPLSDSKRLGFILEGRVGVRLAGQERFLERGESFGVKGAHPYRVRFLERGTMLEVTLP